MTMIYSYSINGIPVKTGDLICTTDGGKSLIAGQFWWLIGKLIPGDVDHIVVYVGPDGKCVEAGAKGCVISFEIPGDEWNASEMFSQRNMLDQLYGIAYPLADRTLSEDDEMAIRQSVAEYCLSQATLHKPYNINFINSETESAFYCSQLAYRAYLRHGIDLNTGKGVPDIPGCQSIIFPQEIWEMCSVQTVA